MKISVIASVFNSEDRIQEMLESVKELADEIIIVDNSSSDKTVQIAKKYTDKIFTRPNNPMLNSNKNFGFSKAKGEWILNLDHDEVVTRELGEEIRSVINSESEVNGYFLPRKNIIFGKWIRYTGWYPDYQLRLFKNGKGKFEEKHVHELLRVEGKTEYLKEPLTHYNYDSIDQFLKKMTTIYTANEAENMIASGYVFRKIDVIHLPVKEFIQRFFAQKGYKDGLHGLVLSLLMAFYHFVVVLKIWEKEGFREYSNGQDILKDGIKSISKDYKYWAHRAEEWEAEGIVTKYYHKVRKKI